MRVVTFRSQLSFKFVRRYRATYIGALESRYTLFEIFSRRPSPLLLFRVVPFVLSISSYPRV